MIGFCMGGGYALALARPRPMGYRAGARLERTLTTIGIDHDVKVYRHLRS